MAMKKLLVVVDFQVDFVNGALGFKGAEALEQPICSLIKKFEDSGDDVVFTLDTHPENYMETEEGKYLPVPHCIKGSSGYELFGEVKNLAKGHKIFEKPTFPSLELGEWLKDKDYDEITVCGLDLSICVLSNAVIAKSALPNAHIKVNLECSSGGDETANKVAIEQLKRIQVEVY
mgnify:CR=1 FL=1